MSLKDDIEEARELWARSSWLKRALIILVLLMSTSPIASLSDIVFDWKGFILDGVEVYRAYLTAPIRRLCARAGLEFTSTQMDATIVLCLFYGGLIRVPIEEPIYRLSRRNSNRIYKGFLVTLLLATIFIGSKYGGKNEQPYVVTYIGIAAATIWFLRRLEPRDRIIFAGPMLFAVAAVLVLGAINAGLTR